VEMDQFSDETWFRARYRFFVDESLSEQALNNIRMVIERPHLWKVSLNGEQLEAQEGEWWLDRHFPVFHSNGKVRRGWNIIELSAPRMSVFAELMPVYILGEFGLQPADKGFLLTGHSGINRGSWKDAGMPFYGHSLSYRHEMDISDPEKIWTVELEGFKGTVAEVWVNEKCAGMIGWRPFKINISDLVVEGNNQIEVKITGSLKNTLGYHHIDQSGWIDGPWSWNQAPEHQPPGATYRFRDYGIDEIRVCSASK